MQTNLNGLNMRAKQLEGAELFQIESDTREKSSTLRFKHWDGRTLAVVCKGVIHCSVSACGANANSEVIGASVQRVEDDILKHLGRFGYLWQLNQDDGSPLEGEWLHVSLDGDLSAVIICRDVVISA